MPQMWSIVANSVANISIITYYVIIKATKKVSGKRYDIIPFKLYKKTKLYNHSVNKTAKKISTTK